MRTDSAGPAHHRLSLLEMLGGKSRFRGMGVAIAMAAALSAAACSRPGDLGRERPNVINDQVLPVAGYWSTRFAREPVSHFNYTDDERLLRNLGWTLVAPAHAEDWLGRTAAQLQRAEIVRRLDLILPPERYAHLLSGANYRSSDVRYARLADDAAKDMAAIAPYFAVVQRVRDADRRRLAAVMALGDIEPGELTAAYGRISENQRQFAWVKRALLFRLYAYRYALDRLMIETPSSQADLVIERLHAFEVMILEALELDQRFAAGLDAPIASPSQPVDLMALVTKA